MKKIISLMLVLLLVVGCFAGCGSNGNAEGEGSKIIGVCMQNKSSSISVLQEEALIEMFEPLGYDVQVVSADDSSATQRSQVENFILLNAEMLVILPCEISTLEDSLIKAREQGIKVVVSGGTGTVSEDAYDAVCSDDEFMVGMYVASVAKTWIEGNMDPNGDWKVHFLSSTLSEDAITRCQGEAMILEQYLKNKNGEYVNLMGEVVDEANKVENPVYCEMVASRVSSYEECSTQMSMSDNRGVVSGVLTEHPNVRVFIAYNSLASTAGSTYITDTYANANEYAFFSGGVMGDEYEYLIGSVAEGAGTYSCFRGACQFGGGDAAATLADLCNRVMFGEAGVDYGKTNPNTIGLYYPIDGEINGGTDALVCFDAPPYISAYTYEEILAQEKLMTYWDSANGYNKNMQEAPVVDVPVVDTPEQAAAGTYTYDYEGIGGTETAQIVLNDDGTVSFQLKDHPMITDAYAGTYTREGNVVTIKALTNVDTASEYKIPGLWDWIDNATGDAVITVDDATGTFVPGAEAAAPAETNVFLYEYEGMGSTDVAQITLNEDGTVQFQLKDHPMITDVYAGTYTREGNVVTIKKLTNVDTASEYKIPGLWDWIDNATGDAVITVNDNGTFVPGAEEAPVASGEAVAAGEYVFMEATPFGEFKWTVTLNEDGTAVVAQPENEQMGNPSWTAVWTDNGDGTFTTAECTGEGPMIAAFWNNNAITWVNNGDGTVTPVGYTG